MNSTPRKAASRLRSLGCAIRGIGQVAIPEPNMRIHLASAVAACGFASWFDLPSEECRWIALSVALVTAAECINTAIECACDVADPEYNPLIGRAKDAAAGGVLISALFAGYVGLSIAARLVGLADWTAR